MRQGHASDKPTGRAMIFLLIILIAGGSIFAAFGSNIQATTKWLGRRIAERKVIRTTEHSFASPLEVQTMISSSGQVARNFSMVVLYLAVGVVGFLIKWWVAIVGLLALVIAGSVIAAVCLPRKFSYWIKWVSVGVQGRIADYRKDNDLDRADSLSVFVPILAEYEQIAEAESLDVTKI